MIQDRLLLAFKEVEMNRRNLLKIGLASAGGMVFLGNAGAATQICNTLLTPPQTKGPFYPINPQLDTDADLVTLTGHSESARGKVVIVTGVVSDQNCKAVSGALVEIWQACESGRYNHPSDPNTAALDPNFQYWGKAVTNANGQYQFRTIVPGAYPASDDWMRPPHIHFKVSCKGYRELITQMYFADETLNDSDLILQDLTPDEQKEVVVQFVERFDRPHPSGNFDIKIQKISNPISKGKI